MNKDNNYSTFFLAFMGQQVIMTTDLSQTTNLEQDDHSTIEAFPIFYSGILLDSDEDYFYLGKNPIEIDQAVKKKNVIHITTVQEENHLKEILENMPGPENEEEVN